MQNTEINTDKTIPFNYELYLKGDYDAYHIVDSKNKIEVVSFRHNNVIGWLKEEVAIHEPAVIVMRKKRPIVWVNVVRNRHGIIFSRVTTTPDTKPQSGNVMIKQYELEIEG
jgi:hypothetical protein